MRILTSAELTHVVGGKGTKVTPVGPKTQVLPDHAAHGIATATAASSKPKPTNAH